MCAVHKPAQFQGNNRVVLYCLSTDILNLQQKQSILLFIPHICEWGEILATKQDFQLQHPSRSNTRTLSSAPTNCWSLLNTDCISSLYLVWISRIVSTNCVDIWKEINTAQTKRHCMYNVQKHFLYDIRHIWAFYKGRWICSALSLSYIWPNGGRKKIQDQH